MGTRDGLTSAAEQQSAKRYLKKRAAIGSTVMTLVVLVGALLTFWQEHRTEQQEMDLSRIGQGLPSVVQAFDPTCTSCRQLRRMVEQLRPEFEEQMVFLMVDLSTPAGAAFAETNQVGSVTLVFFDATGERIGVLEGLQEADYLWRVFTEITQSN